MRRKLVSGFLALPFLACAPPATLNLLTRASEPERNFLREHLKPFEAKNNCVIRITAYSDAASLGARLAAGDSLPDLAEIPDEAAPTLIRNGELADLDPWIDSAGRQAWRRNFFFTETWPGSQHYLLPRFLETKLLVYSRRQVREAAEHWAAQRSEIDSVLRRYNGRGLPLNYRLEDNPAQWDFYDVFVAGWFWKTHESRGATHGRLVCDDGGNADARALSLWDRGARLGADTADLARMRGPAVQQLFQWQAAFAQQGLCHPAATGDGADLPLLTLFQNGEVFLAEVYPRLAWRIHGDETVQYPAAAPDPEDVGVCTLPRGAALDLDAAGLAAEKTDAAFTRVWWFAVPARARAPALAVKLAGFLDAAKLQIEESAGFGLMPARKDLLADLSLLYGNDWTEAAFQAAAAQLLANGYTTGLGRPGFFDLADLYDEAYRQLCLGPKTRSASEIAQALAQQFAPRARQILANPAEGGKVSWNP